MKMKMVNWKLEIDFNLIILISILGESDQTDEKLETPVVERRSTETEQDGPTESLGKSVDWFSELNNLNIL